MHTSRWILVCVLGAQVLAGCQKSIVTVKGELGDGTVAVRHFAQIRESMAVVTNVDANDSAITNFYNANRPRFSLDGNAQAISASMLLATTSMAGLFCTRLVDADRALGSDQRRAHGGLDFTKDQKKVTAAAAEPVFQNYARLFWRREASKTEIAALWSVIAESQSRTASTAEMRNAWIGACTSALSSLEFIKS